MTSRAEEAFPEDEAMQRLASHFEAAGGADEWAQQLRSVARRLGNWAIDVGGPPFDMNDLPPDLEADLAALHS